MHGVGVIIKLCFAILRYLTLALQVCVGGTVIYPHSYTRFSHHCAKTAWNFLERFPDFSKKFIGYKTPKEFFLISLAVPQILLGNKVQRKFLMVKNWFQA